MKAIPSSTVTSPDDLPLTHDALELLARAADEAGRLGHEYVGTEHLVFAMSRPQNGPQSGPQGGPQGGPRGGPVATLLTGAGVDLDAVWRTLAGVVSPGPARPAGAPGGEHHRPYTSRTQRAFALAAESARELGHARIRSIHLLVGLMREGRNPGAQVLAHHGLTAEAAHDGARQLVAHGDAP